MYLLIRLLSLYRHLPCGYLHPTMYLLIRGCGHLGKTIFNQFTSHYVSINSNCPNASMTVSSIFTSHYVSINSYNISYLIYEHENKFTSHYVSINSADLILLFFAIGNLHPTMYLLILFAFIKSVCYYLSFTSHYVSINSVSIPSL